MRRRTANVLLSAHDKGEPVLTLREFEALHDEADWTALLGSEMVNYPLGKAISSSCRPARLQAVCVDTRVAD